MSKLNPRMHLSRHFQLWEFTQSMTARRKGLDNVPSARAVERMQELCKLLDVVRDRWGPIRITSGFRCAELNRLIGSNASSAHPWGCAADFQPAQWQAPLPVIMEWLVAQKESLRFDQVIFEFGGWIHLGIPKPEAGPARLECLMTFGGGEYVPWNPADPRVHA